MTYWVVLGSLWWCHASWNHWERKEKSTNDDFCFPCLTSVNHPVLKVFSGDADGFLMLGSRIPLALDPKKKNSCDYKLYGYLRTIIFVAIITQCWIVSFFFIISRDGYMAQVCLYQRLKKSIVIWYISFVVFLFIQPPMQLDGKGTQSWFCDNVKLLSSHILFYHDI